MSDSNLILEVKGLNKWFGATYANKNIDFQLRPGEVRGLAGENGSSPPCSPRLPAFSPATPAKCF